MSEENESKPVIPEFSAAQRWNLVWVVPILALLVGGWLVYRNLVTHGSVAKVRFETADGIQVGTTEVRCRSVRVGVVKGVKLADDLKSVVVSVQMDPDTGALLREDTRFWVVRLRVSGAEISGLGTLLEGAYIELEPGRGAASGGGHYVGLESPPPTDRTVPGLRLVLTADEAGSLVAGSPIFHRGVEVGRIESRRFGPDGRDVIYDAFIPMEHTALVKENTRFWNSSGVDISAGASGIKVRTPSFQAMVSGGASFGVPDGLPPGGEVRDGTVFKLYPDQDGAAAALFDATHRMLLLFDQSVLGLAKGAAVRFRGIQIGRVLEVSFDLLPDRVDSRIPVLVELDAGLLSRGLEGNDSAPDDLILSEVVDRGLRASLKTESLITGSLYVDLDCYPNEAAATVERIGDLPVMPTVSAGFAKLEEKLSAILEKLERLDLDALLVKVGKAADEAAETVAAARTSLDEINATADAARKILDDPSLKAVPADLRKVLEDLQKTVASIGPEGAVQGDLLRTLDELRGSLRSIKSLSTTLDEKPSSLLFGRDSSGNAEPRAPRGKR